MTEIYMRSKQMPHDLWGKRQAFENKKEKEDSMGRAIAHDASS